MDDSIFYRDGVNTRLRMAMLIVARRRMFNLFMNSLSPTQNTTILDIGVSSEDNEGANFLEKSYPWQSQITLAGLSDGDELKSQYSQSRYVKMVAGERLPFQDHEFDIACSNAVIEHVGGEEERRFFISEHLRVARNVFITCPNRWFPIEHHTALPMIHYSKSLFRRWVQSGPMGYWADPRNMELLDVRQMAREWPVDTRDTLKMKMTGLPLGPFSSNFAMIVKRP